MPSVNRKILVWARETAGLTVEQAAKKLGFRSSRGTTTAQKLEALEAPDGGVEPSRSIIVRMAKQYRRSLLVFYLEDVPRKGPRGRDFRHVARGRQPSE